MGEFQLQDLPDSTDPRAARPRRMPSAKALPSLPGGRQNPHVLAGEAVRRAVGAEVVRLASGVRVQEDPRA